MAPVAGPWPAARPGGWPTASPGARRAPPPAGRGPAASGADSSPAAAEPIERHRHTMSSLHPLHDLLIRPLALHGRSATRQIETRAQAGQPPHTLMQRAGLAVAR